MTTQDKSTKVSILNMILLGLAVFTSLATLAPDGSTGRSRVRVDWDGSPTSLNISIAPATGLVSAFEPERTHRLHVKITEVPDTTESRARWALRVVEAPDFLATGDFNFEEDDDVFDAETRVGALLSVLGPFCRGGEESDVGCIPCALDAGCNLKLDVDLCTPGLGGDIYIFASVEPEDYDYTLRCPEDDDSKPCDDLDAWLMATISPLETRLCDE